MVDDPISRRGPGRPPVPIPESPTRYRRAMCEVFSTMFVFSPSPAARSAAAFDGGHFAVTSGSGPLRFCVPILNSAATGIAGKAGTITRTRTQFRAAAEAEDLLWLDQSAAYFYCWLHACVRDDEAEEAVNVGKLREIDRDWPNVIDRAVRALIAAPRTVCLPFERQPLPKRLQPFLRAILLRWGTSLDANIRARCEAGKSPTRR